MRASAILEFVMPNLDWNELNQVVAVVTQESNEGNAALPDGDYVMTAQYLTRKETKKGDGIVVMCLRVVASKEDGKISRKFLNQEVESVYFFQAGKPENKKMTMARLIKDIITISGRPPETPFGSQVGFEGWGNQILPEIQTE